MSTLSQKHEISSQPIPSAPAADPDHRKIVVTDKDFNDLWNKIEEGKLIPYKPYKGWHVYSICSFLPKVTIENLEAAKSFFILLVQKNEKLGCKILIQEEIQGALIHFLNQYAEDLDTPLEFIKFLTQTFPHTVEKSMEEYENLPEHKQGSAIKADQEQSKKRTGGKIRLLKGISKDYLKLIHYPVAQQKWERRRAYLVQCYSNQINRSTQDLDDLRILKRGINKIDLIKHSFDHISFTHYDDNGFFDSQDLALRPSQEPQHLTTASRLLGIGTVQENAEGIFYVGKRHTYRDCSVYYAALMEIIDDHLYHHYQIRIQHGLEKESPKSSPSPTPKVEDKATPKAIFEDKEFSLLREKLGNARIDQKSNTIIYQMPENLPKVNTDNIHAATRFFTELRQQHAGKFKIEHTQSLLDNTSNKNKELLRQGKKPEKTVNMVTTFISYYVTEQNTPIEFIKFLLTTFPQSIEDAIKACDQWVTQYEDDILSTNPSVAPYHDKATLDNRLEAMYKLLCNIDSSVFSSIDKNLRIKWRQKLYDMLLTKIKDCNDIKSLEQLSNQISTIDFILSSFDDVIIKDALSPKLPAWLQGIEVSQLKKSPFETAKNVVYHGKNGRRYEGFSPYAVSLIEHIYERHHTLTTSNKSSYSTSSTSKAEEKKAINVAPTTAVVEPCTIFIVPAILKECLRELLHSSAPSLEETNSGSPAPFIFNPGPPIKTSSPKGPASFFPGSAEAKSSVPKPPAHLSIIAKANRAHVDTELQAIEELLNATFPSKDERDVWLEQIKDYKEMTNPTNNDVIILMKVRSALVDAIDALNQPVVADDKHSHQNLAEAQEDRLVEEEAQPDEPGYTPLTLAPAENGEHEEEEQVGEQREGERVENTLREEGAAPFNR